MIKRRTPTNEIPSSTSKLIGHIAAFLTVMVWGTTFISTKVLLVDFTPVEVLILRFVIGYLALSVIRPRPLRFTSLRAEVPFVIAGATGLFVYYLLENVALTISFASNVSTIVSTAPLFCAILVAVLSRFKGERVRQIRSGFIVGFVLAIVGIALISFNGAAFELNPLGDFLALLAAISWAAYTAATDGIFARGTETIAATRRIFFYGIVFMIPLVFTQVDTSHLVRLAEPVNLANLLFLGLIASAVCFCSWNFAVKRVGAVETSVYIYLTPVITVVFSALVLHEPVSVLMVTGIILVLAGLIVSEHVTASES